MAKCNNLNMRKFEKKKSQICWSVPLIPELARQRQGVLCQFEVRLIYIMRFYLKKTRAINKQINKIV